MGLKVLANNKVFPPSPPRWKMFLSILKIVLPPLLVFWVFKVSVPMPIQPQTALALVNVFHCFSVSFWCTYSKSFLGNLISGFGGPCSGLALTRSELTELKGKSGEHLNSYRRRLSWEVVLGGGFILELNCMKIISLWAVSMAVEIILEEKKVV